MPHVSAVLHSHAPIVLRHLEMRAGHLNGGFPKAMKRETARVPKNATMLSGAVAWQRCAAVQSDETQLRHAPRCVPLPRELDAVLALSCPVSRLSTRFFSV